MLPLPAQFAAVLSACGPTAYEQCLLDEEARIFDHEKNTACGCDAVPCAHGTVCFEGDCCDPVLEPEKCGCSDGCADGELCHEQACCDPTLANTEENCGCTGPCDTDAKERCVAGMDGNWTCQCEPDLAAFYSPACGCGDPCTEAYTCIDGVCACDPTSPVWLFDDENCGCDGPCPADATCIDGACVCFDVSEQSCDPDEDGVLTCEDEHTCTCDVAVHQFDMADCGCLGPCATGDRCDYGTCVCDPLAHLEDSTNCACAEACGTDSATQYIGNTLEGEVDFDLDLACAQGLCGCPEGFTVCQRGTDFDVGVLSYEGRCVTTSLSWCADCSSSCAVGACVTLDEDNDGRADGFECR